MTKVQYYYHCLPLDEKTEFAVSVEIPNWHAAELAFIEGKPTPLDTFIHNHEPAGRVDELGFRSDLQALLDYIFYLGGAPTLRGSLHFRDKSDFWDTSNGD